MKKTIKLAVVAALALGTTSAFATNGDLMIGQGAKSRAMGGVGIAKSFGAESGLANPAMISSVEKSEATLVVTAFAATVSGVSDMGGPSAAESTSQAQPSVIPEIAYATRISDNTVVGLSVSGTAGMGVDYDEKNNADGMMRMKTALSLLKIAAPVSYEIGNLTVGLAGILQYGTLGLSHNYDHDGDPATVLLLQDDGISSDIGYGLEVGMSYDVTKDLTLGAVYKSKIGMTYKNTISGSIAIFDQGTGMTGIKSGDNLAQPEERGIGISYTIGENTIAADYKNIAWGDAEGYADFGWENQDVYALGYEHASKSYAVRLGYNYAKSPIQDQGATYPDAVKNFFNLSGFPGIVETHYTIGAGYNVSDALAIDGSFIYVPETPVTYGIAPMFGAGAASQTETVKHSQMALTLAMSYKF